MPEFAYSIIIAVIFSKFCADFTVHINSQGWILISTLQHARRLFKNCKSTPWRYRKSESDVQRRSRRSCDHFMTCDKLFNKKCCKVCKFSTEQRVDLTIEWKTKKQERGKLSTKFSKKIIKILVREHINCGQRSWIKIYDPNRQGVIKSECLVAK